MRKKKNDKSMSFLEKFIWVINILLFFSIPISAVYVKARLSETNIAYESIKHDIEEQEKTNEGLKMEINELASLDKIQEVAQDNGLNYNNDNVKVVEEEE